MAQMFTIEIAGTAIGVQPMFFSTREYCREYLTDRQPELMVQVTGEDLVFQQNLLEREAVEEGLKIRKFTEPFLERATIQRKAADYLAGRNVLLLHGSTVAVDGQAYLFTAPCGTGKSTHTRLWREMFGQRAIMINDDKPFLEITPDGVLAYGSPWSGKHGLATNVCVPLKGICLLRRGQENVIYPLEPAKGVELLQKQAHIPENSSPDAVFSLIEALLEKVPLWEMSCNRETDAARVSYSAMCRGLSDAK